MKLRRVAVAAALTVLAVLVAGPGEAWAGGVPAGWGENGSGQVGDGTTAYKPVPVAVSGLTEVKEVSSGGDHTLALMKNGTVRAWGDNSCGQLGNGSTTSSSTPVTVEGVSEVVAVAAGDGYSLALLSNGTIKAWGCNGSGQLGDGTTSASSTPVSVSGVSNATAIAAAYDHALAVVGEGSVVAWGHNSFGDLGSGSYTESSDVPVSVSGLTEASAVAAGGSFSLALLKGGTVESWGDNQFGELGTGNAGGPHSCLHTAFEFGCTDTPVEVSGLSNVASIAAGEDSALALLKSGSVKAWGANYYGQLGTGSESGPEYCLQEFSVNEAGKTEWYEWPVACAQAPVTVSELSSAVAVSSSEELSLALLSNGTVKSWGSGARGNSSSTRDVPQSIPGVGEVEAIAAGGDVAFSLGAPIPTVTSVSPANGPGTGGTTVEIGGTNFTGVKAVKFNGAAASSYTVNSSTSITAVAPAHRPGVTDVTVVTGGGTSATGTADVFTYVPETLGIGRCQKLATSTGKYRAGSCIEAVEGGKYEWYAGIAKDNLTVADSTETVEKVVKSKKVTIETVGKTKLVCGGLSGSGEYLGTTAIAGLTLTLTGCQLGESSCSSAGASSGEIVTKTLTGTLGWREKEANAVGLGLSPASEGGALIEAVCGSYTVLVSGGVVGYITPVNSMSSTFTLKYKASKGKQSPEGFQGEPAEVLSMAVSGGTAEQAGLSLDGSLVNEEELEINTVI